MTYLQERFTSFSDFLTGLLVSVLFANMSTPLSDYFLLENVGLIESHENFGHGRKEVRMRESNEPLNAAEQSFLMLLGGDCL